ncbi:hypothetical protein NDU88_006533 [Pleurodeles waltl]|uniref:Uncharacterized protein n=1 Tax=Pleurodeles waltl TaxID=8319 RepID=A0AAV7PLP0_PLEWA|nr:hypothetical protein NDU88_006533 [Pleurodeles waltl]
MVKPKPPRGHVEARLEEPLLIEGSDSHSAALHKVTETLTAHSIQIYKSVRLLPYICLSYEKSMLLRPVRDRLFPVPLDPKLFTGRLRTLDDVGCADLSRGCVGKDARSKNFLQRFTRRARRTGTLTRRAE